MNNKSKKTLFGRTFLVPLYLSLLGSFCVLILCIEDLMGHWVMPGAFEMLAFKTFMSFVMLIIPSYIIFILISIFLCFILPRINSPLIESIVGMVTAFRLTVFCAAVAALVFGVESYQTSYARYLPSTASNVKIDQLGFGNDWSLYMRADVDEEGFMEFVSSLELAPTYESDHNFSSPEISVSDWWHPEERNPYFGRSVHSESHPDAVTDYLWATHEDGALYFSHQHY